MYISLDFRCKTGVLFITVFIILCYKPLAAQQNVRPDFYLNEGEFYNNPIYIHSRQMLISSPASVENGIIEASRVTIWDLKTSSVLKNIFIGNNSLTSLQKSPSEKYLIFTFEDSTKIFDLSAMKWIFTYANSKFYEFNQSFSRPRFFKHDSVMLFYTEGNLFYTNSGDWKRIERFNSDVKIDLNQLSLELFFSSSSIGVFENKQLQVIDIPSGKIIQKNSIGNYLENDFYLGEVLPFDNFKKVAIYRSIGNKSKLAVINLADGSMTNQLSLNIAMTKLNIDALLPSGNSILLFGNRYVENSFINGYLFYKIDLVNDSLLASEYSFKKVKKLTNFTFEHLKYNEHSVALIDYEAKTLNTVNFKSGKSYFFKCQEYIDQIEIIDSNLVAYVTNAPSIDASPSLEIANTITGKSIKIEPYPYTIRNIKPDDPFNLIYRTDSGNYKLVKIKDDLSNFFYKELNTNFKKIGIYPVNFYHDTLIFYCRNETYFDNSWTTFFNSDPVKEQMTNVIMLHVPTSFSEARYLPQLSIESFIGSDCYYTFKMYEGNFNFPIGIYFWDTKTAQLIGYVDMDSLQKSGTPGFNFYNAKLFYNSSKNKLLYHDVNGFGVLDIKNGFINKLFHVQSVGSIHVSFCNNERNISVMYLNRFCIYDATNGKLVFSKEKSTKDDWLDCIANKYNSSYLVRYRNAIELRNFQNNMFSKKIEKSNKLWLGNYLTAGMGNNLFYSYEGTGVFSVYHVKNGQLAYRDSIGACNNFMATFLEDSAILYFNQNGLPTVWNLIGNTSQVFQSKIDIGPFLQFRLYPEKNLLITTSFNNIYFWNVEKGLLESRFIVPDTSEFLMIDRHGYYKSSKSLYPKIRGNLGTRVFSPAQLDAIYNRPDKVLQTLGSAFRETDTSLMNSYTNAWLKRINKLGLDTALFKNDFTFPEAYFENKDNVAYEQSIHSGKLILNLTAKDSISQLMRYNIWVNEVPVFGKLGINIPSDNSKEFKKELTVSLSNGINKIEASVYNQNGLENFRSPLYVRYIPREEPKEKLFFIGIGVNKYLQPGHNLNYSVKDIRDLANLFKNKYGENIIIDTLFDEQVTKERILLLKRKLLNSDVNDKVIVSFSGHGLLDKQYDYYLATHNINFQNPAENGLPYEDLEWLLDSIPSRKKLLLMDACHSGEVDKEELLAIQTNKPEGTKGAELEYEYTPTIGMKNSFELMQELFTNVNRGTGATVISAAGGTQYAYEKGNLQNGVFTYSILELMNQKNEIKVSELKTRVGERVTELTNGMQKPTSRQETIEFDWKVW